MDPAERLAHGTRRVHGDSPKRHRGEGTLKAFSLALVASGKYGMADTHVVETDSPTYRDLQKVTEVGKKKRCKKI